MAMLLTRTLAMTVLDQIEEQYAPYIRAARMKPRLAENHTVRPGLPVLAWAVVWPEGPSGWAIHTAHSGMIDSQFVQVEPVTGTCLALYATARPRNLRRFR